MSEVKFTPGPWVARYCDRVATSDDIDGSKSIARIYQTQSACQRANQALVAAAPELYEALSDALTAMEHMGDVINAMDIVEPEDEKHFPAFDKARKALAKARGEHNE